MLILGLKGLKNLGNRKSPVCMVVCWCIFFLIKSSRWSVNPVGRVSPFAVIADFRLCLVSSISGVCPLSL